MKAARTAVVALLVLAGGAAAHVQQQEVPGRPEKPENFSPLGFEDLRSYQQAYPAAPGTPAVVRAAQAKYWVFRGLAYRGSMTSEGAAWVSTGPLSTTEGGASGSGNFSGRVAALAISPTCRLAGYTRPEQTEPGGQGSWV